MKTSELEGIALDLIVDRLEGGCAPTNPDHLRIYLESLNEDELWNELCKYTHTPGNIRPDIMSKEEMIEDGIAAWRWPPLSTDWAFGGPIIEREMISVWPFDDVTWKAETARDAIVFEGETPLVAAMRCYVASKMGDTVDIPEELI